MPPEDAVDIVLEACEVLLNHILFVRGVYPGQIFKKRCVYNTPVFVSIYPPLNIYLGNVLRAARELLQRRQLQCLEIIVYRDEGEQLESYRFELASLIDSSSAAEDQYLLLYEQQLRSALYKLAERVKQLPKLDNEAKFKVQLHTTQTGFVQLSHEAQYQEFPWLQASSAPHDKPQQQRMFKLLPLATVDMLGLKMQAHIFT